MIARDSEANFAIPTSAFEIAALVGLPASNTALALASQQVAPYVEPSDRAGSFLSYVYASLQAPNRVAAG